MIISNDDSEFFVSQATSGLSNFHLPLWAISSNQKLSIFRYWDLITAKKVKGLDNALISVGDQIQVTVSFSPVIRLDGNIIVAFMTNCTPRVTREIQETQSLITGFKAWFLSRRAKNALPRNEQVRLEITIIYECYIASPSHNYYKIISPPVCIPVKL